MEPAAVAKFVLKWSRTVVIIDALKGRPSTAIPIAAYVCGINRKYAVALIAANVGCHVIYYYFDSIPSMSQSIINSVQTIKRVANAIFDSEPLEIPAPEPLTRTDKAMHFLSAIQNTANFAFTVHLAYLAKFAN